MNIVIWLRRHTSKDTHEYISKSIQNADSYKHFLRRAIIIFWQMRRSFVQLLVSPHFDSISRKMNKVYSLGRKSRKNSMRCIGKWQDCLWKERVYMYFHRHFHNCRHKLYVMFNCKLWSLFGRHKISANFRKYS